MGLRPLASWDCGFESRRGHRCLSLVSVVCCHIKVSVKGRSLVQRSPTECVLCLNVILKPRWWGGPGPLGAVAPWGREGGEKCSELTYLCFPHAILLMLNQWQFFYLAHLQNREKLPIASSCLSSRPDGTTRLPLDGFSWNFVFQYFPKICFMKIWQE